MPRYQYSCKECGQLSNFVHLSDEVETDCPKCNSSNTLVKVLTQFRTTKAGTKKQKIGHLTEQFIEDSRQDLELQRDKLTKNR